MVIRNKIGILQDETHHNLLLLVLRIERIEGEEMPKVEHAACFACTTRPGDISEAIGLLGELLHKV